MAKRDFFDVIKEQIAAIAPGLKNLAPDIAAELSRLNTQGTMELASALFGNGAFVPYGPGQYTPKPEIGKENPQQEASKGEAQKEHEREHSGREME
jgi:hypothetical protein